MGAYISKQSCSVYKSIHLNCTVTRADGNKGPITTIGGYRYGEFPPDADIAGSGIINAFAAVAFIALAVSAVYLILQLTPAMKMTGMESSIVRPNVIEEDTDKVTDGDTVSHRTTWAHILEGVILSCSDQQVFTSGAYVITLRYQQGCKISAYHYNILGNMMLMTCATHLMSVTVVSQYWKHKLLATARVLLVTALYIATALLLANQNAGLDLTWPTDVPAYGINDTLLVLPAACFQDDGLALQPILKDSFGRGGNHLSKDVLLNSSPKNHVRGWNFFLLMILWYGFAALAELVKLWFHGFIRCCVSRITTQSERRRDKFKRYINWAYWFYQLSGVVFCCIAGTMSYRYIIDLKTWMNQSPWLEKEFGGTNPEFQLTTFGQLVPMLLTLLTVFAFLQLIGDRYSDFFHKRKILQRPDSNPPQRYSPVGQDSTSYTGYNNGYLPPVPEKKDTTSATITSVPSTPGLSDVHQPLMYHGSPADTRHSKRPSISSYPSSSMTSPTFSHGSPQIEQTHRMTSRSSQSGIMPSPPIPSPHARPGFTPRQTSWNS